MTKFYAGQQGLKTRDGRNVKIYAVYDSEIHGAYLIDRAEKWRPIDWDSDGSWSTHQSNLDIIAPVETVVRYMNVYRNDFGRPWKTDTYKGDDDCIARWKIHRRN